MLWLIWLVVTDFGKILPGILFGRSTLMIDLEVSRGRVPQKIHPVKTYTCEDDGVLLLLQLTAKEREKMTWSMWNIPRSIFFVIVYSNIIKSLLIKKNCDYRLSDKKKDIEYVIKMSFTFLVLELLNKYNWQTVLTLYSIDYFWIMTSFSIFTQHWKKFKKNLSKVLNTLKIVWKMKNAWFSIKYTVFQRRQKVLSWSKGLAQMICRKMWHLIRICTVC